MKLYNILFFIFFFISIGIHNAFAQNGGCLPSELTDDEARILIYMTPIAINAWSHGADVNIEQSKASEEFPAPDYFVAAVVTQKPTSNSVLGNGILGYFSVDKHSAVVESLSDFTEVKSIELMHIQNWMRHEHCIRTHGHQHD